MSDAHAVARDQLRAFIERIERLEEEKKTIADDIKDVYGEAKGTGFDTKVLRKLISIRKQDLDERAEQEAILDMYMIALGMVDEPAGYDEPRQSTPAQRQPAMALRADGGVNIVTKHKDIAASGGSPSAPSSLTTREAEESVVPNPEMDRATEGSFETGSEAAEKGRKATATVAAPADLNHAGAGESPATEKVTVATQEEAAEPTSDDGEATGNYAGEDRAAANAGGDHVDGNALRVPTSVTGEGAANTALPAKPKVSFRPNCQHPENCASGTRDHCWSCRRAMQKREEIA